MIEQAHRARVQAQADRLLEQMNSGEQRLADIKRRAEETLQRAQMSHDRLALEGSLACCRQGQFMLDRARQELQTQANANVVEYGEVVLRCRAEMHQIQEVIESTDRNVARVAATLVEVSCLEHTTITVQDQTQKKNTCVVCITDMELEAAARRCPKCKHCYHAACILPWLADEHTCPQCRCQLINSQN